MVRSKGRWLECANTVVQQSELREPAKLCLQKPYLGFDEDGSEAVEKLDGSDDLALHKGACENRCCCPPTCADWHFPKPGLEREASLPSDAAISTAHHLVHCAVLYPDVLRLAGAKGALGLQGWKHS